jgi:hypothetical protein
MMCGAHFGQSPELPLIFSDVYRNHIFTFLHMSHLRYLRRFLAVSLTLRKGTYSYTNISACYSSASSLTEKMTASLGQF